MGILGHIDEIQGELLTKSRGRLTWAMLANGLQNLVERQVLLPLLSIPNVIASARAIQPQEPGQAIGAQFAFEDVKGVPLELLVR
jgi:hypothetical protein